jgi:serine/threonine protein kinase
LQLPALVTFQPAASPSSPPELTGFKYAATLGGKPASGLTYLYERKRGKGAEREKWVVKYFSLPSFENLAALQSILAAYFGVEQAALHHLRAYSLVPSTSPTHLALCFPLLKDANLARSTRLDLGSIYDVMSGTLGALAALHQQGLAHGHICAENLFLETTGQVALTDSGQNAIRSLIGAELTGPVPSASHDLMALGDLCLNLLGESGSTPGHPQAAAAGEPQPDWPGAPLQALACRLRQDSQLSANQALLLLKAVPRPQVSRLLTVPEWRGFS